MTQSDGRRMMAGVVPDLSNFQPRGALMHDEFGHDSRPLSGRTSRIASCSILVLALAAIWVLSGFAISQRNVTQKLLADFGIAPPPFTRLLLSIPTAAVVGTAAIASAVLVVKEWRLPNKQTALIINLAAFAVCLVLYAVHREALVTPVQKLLIDLTSTR